MKTLTLILLLSSSVCYSAEVSKCATVSRPKTPTPANLLPSQPNLRQQTGVFLYNDVNAIPIPRTSKSKTSGAISRTSASKKSPYKPAPKSPTKKKK